MYVCEKCSRSFKTKSGIDYHVFNEVCVKRRKYTFKQQPSEQSLENFYIKDFELDKENSLK